MQESSNFIQRRIYMMLLIMIYGSWLLYMSASSSWSLFSDFWPISLTMVFGSFVAGATPGGGAAVAFPVFTKMLEIPASDARTFGLMIQAVGMSMAGIIIWIRRVPILNRVIMLVTVGGIAGQLLGTFCLVIPPPYPKVMFSFVIAVFGVALAISFWGLKATPRKVMPEFGSREKSIFMTVGVVGGIFAANTGAGIDMLTFIVLTLAYGIDEKISTPSSVLIMGINSIVGFFLHGVIVQDIAMSFNYWLVAIPIVVVGAPLGAIFCAKVDRKYIVILLLALITVEFSTTVLLVPMNRPVLVVGLISVAVCIAWFWGMLRCRICGDRDLI